MNPLLSPPGKPFPAVLQEALRRLCADQAPSLPASVTAAPADAREGKRLAAWVRREADLALVEAGLSLDAALGSSAQILLVQVDEAWYLVDCRDGTAALWTGEGDGVAHLSTLDAAAVRRILTLRPAQDIAPRVATDRAEQPALLPFLRAYRGRLLELVIASVVINVIGLMLPLFTSLVYDKVVGNGITETLWALAVGLTLFIGLDLLLKAARTHTVETVACRLDARIDRRLLEQLFDQRGPLPPVGLMLARYRDFVAARDFLSSSWLLTLADAPFIALYLVVIATIGGPVVFVPIGVAAAMMLAQFLLHLPAQRYAELASQSQTRKTTVLAEVLGAGEVVRSTHLRYALGRRFGQFAERGALAQARGRFWANLGHHATGAAATLGAMGVLVLGVYRIEARELSVGGLVACSMLSARALHALAGMVHMLTRWRELRIASRKFQELFAQDPAEAARPPIDPAAAQWQSRSNSLSLRAVSFEHDPKRPLIDKLSLDIPPGQFVVLLGKPGAGKSTLLKLLGGLLRPAHGDVMFDGHSLADWPAEVRARRIGIKPQEAILFEGTLAENLIAGAESQVTDASFAQALAVSGLDHWIANGELSLSQPLLPGGVNLSGGQRQVVALARALVADSQVLLLDEPTVGLDQATEQAIVMRLRAWARGRTLVVATHSMAMVNVADRLVVLDGGRVVADGPRDKVLMQPGQAAAGAPRGAPAQAASPARPGMSPTGPMPGPAGRPMPSGVDPRQVAPIAAMAGVAAAGTPARPTPTA